MVEVDTSPAKIKDNILYHNPTPNFIMDRFPPSSSRKPRLNKHRKTPNRKEANYLSQKSAESAERKYSSWNPFVPGSGSSSFTFGKIDGLSGESSAFDANRNLNTTSFDSNSNANSLSRDSSLGSEEGLVFTAISDVMKRTGSGGSDQPKSGIFDSGIFNELPNEMKKMNLKSSYVEDFAKGEECGNSSKPIIFASGMSEKQPFFVFKSKTEGIDDVSDNEKNRETKNLFGSEGYTNGTTAIKIEPASFGSEISGSTEPFVFVFGSGGNTNVNSSRNSSVGPPDEPRKVNLKSTFNEGDAVKTKASDNIFVFGSNLNSSKLANVSSVKSTARSASFRSERSDVFNAGAFVFGSGANSSTNLSRNSSLGSVESCFSEIPDETGKVDFASNIHGLERKHQPENHFASGSNNSSLNTESAFIPGAIPIPNRTAGGKSYSTNFVFGSRMKKNPGFSESSSIGSDEGLFSKLPDYIIEKPKSIENNFLFGSDKCTTGGIGENRALKEMAKFSDGINTSSQGMKSTSLAGGEFKFAANKDKEMNQNDNNGYSNGFVFGGTSSFDPLNYNKANLNPGTNVENPTVDFANKVDMCSIPSSPMFSPVGNQLIMDFKAPLTKETLFTGTSHNKPFTVKKNEARNVKVKKKQNKTRQSVPIYQKNPMQIASGRNNSPVNINVYSSGDCSPMDCSPYHDNVTSDRYSRETSVTSEDTEYSVLEAQRLNISADSASPNEQMNEDNMGYDNESKTCMVRQPSENIGAFNFKFTATSSTHDPVPAVKINTRRKFRSKACQYSSSSTSGATAPFSSSSVPDVIPHTDTSLFNPVGANCNNISAKNLDDSKKGSSQEFENSEKSPSLNSSSSADQALCEKWRLRGNQAYSNGHLSKAEDYYTRGVNSISSKEIPSVCIRPLTLCYSNRAVTRVSLGKIREALSDSKMALSIDPAFVKAQVRVANCHLALGEIGQALKHFKKCLQSEKGNNSDQKYLNEASDGLEKAKKVADLTGQSAELLLRRTSTDASKAFSMIYEALSFSPYSESLLEMKAEALLMMRNYTEVIKLCEETLDLAERNSDSPSENFSSPGKFWRSCMIAKSYFYLGKLETALELLQQYEKVKPSADTATESSSMFVNMIQELLRLKSAGNEAFQASRHSEAVEYYTSALMYNAESRPFTAVCFCNRAAAYQALGQISDAIADCSLAIALDSSYAKAISRRATLHEMIRDYGQAANDLNRLISLLQKQMKDLDNESSGAGKSSSLLAELKRARSRLVTVEEESRKEISLDMYMILGIEVSSSAADIKKAYRKAALKYHPDKVGQSLVRNENVDDESWGEVVAEVHADADRLFKMIGEAYATLSDPSKRLKYDEEEEMRTCSFKSYNVGSTRYTADVYNYYHESGIHRHSRAYGNSY